MKENTDRYTTFKAAMTIVASSFGGATGIMGNIFAASQLKLFGYLFFLLLSFALFYLTIQFLCISSEISKKPDLNDLSYSLLGGTFGSLFTRMFVVIGNWCVVVALIQIFADFLPPILYDILNITDSIFLSRWFAVLIGLILISPYFIVNSVSHLGNLSIFCFVLVLIPFTVLLCNGIIAVTTRQTSAIEWYTLDIKELFIGMANMSWCWCCHYNVLPVYATLHRENKPTQMKVVTLSAGCIIFICFLFSGLSVYFVWGDRINQDFITNLDPNNVNYIFYLPPWLSKLSQLFMCIASFISSPIYILEARVNLHSVITQLYHSCKMIKHEDSHTETAVMLTNIHNGDVFAQENVSLVEHKSDNESDINENTAFHMDASANMTPSTGQETSLGFRIIEGGFLCVSAAMVALLVSDVKLVFSINGASYCVYIGYIFPSIVYHKVMQKFRSEQKSVLSFMSKSIFVYGFIVGIVGIISVIVI